MGKRGADLGLSYMPGFQYSDAWISAGKANTPLEWLNVDYEGNLSNSDLDHMKTNVYNYVYDTLTAMRDGGVDIIGVKHGNEQNQGIIWPVGKGSKSKGTQSLLQLPMKLRRMCWEECPDSSIRIMDTARQMQTVFSEICWIWEQRWMVRHFLCTADGE